MSPAAAARTAPVRAGRAGTARSGAARSGAGRSGPVRAGAARAGAAAPARRPALRVVTPVASRAPRAPFVLFSMLLVGLGLVGLLVLNTVVAQDAFTLHDLDRNAATLAEREQLLRQQVAALEAPAAVADRATKIGLVQAGDPVFLGADGRVLGNPVAATAPPAPPAPKPSAAPSGSAPTAGPAKPGTAPVVRPTVAAKP
jgi:cell division protein FtsB